MYSCSAGVRIPLLQPQAVVTDRVRVGLEREVSTALLRLERSVGGRSVFDSNVSGSGEGSNP